MGSASPVKPPADADQDLYAKYFEVCHRPLEGRDRVWRAVTAYLERRYIPADAVVLELGAGYCPFINQIHSRHRYALDRSPAVREHAAADVTTLVQTCTDLSNLPAEYFDVVFASNLLEHLTLTDSGATLDHVLRVLRPGGHLILLQPNFAYAYKQYFDDVTHKQIFTHVSLANFLEMHGFTICESRPKFLPFSMRGTRMPTFSWLVTAYLLSPIKPFAGQMLMVARR
jgi:SAM-dependent methyltransferase